MFRHNVGVEIVFVPLMKKVGFSPIEIWIGDSDDIFYWYLLFYIVSCLYIFFVFSFVLGFYKKPCKEINP